MIQVSVYQDETLSSVRVWADRIEAHGDQLKLWLKNNYVGSVYFAQPLDCHHIVVSQA